MAELDPQSSPYASHSVERIHDMLERKAVESYNQASPTKVYKKNYVLRNSSVGAKGTSGDTSTEDSYTPRLPRRLQHFSEDANQLSPARLRRIEMRYDYIPESLSGEQSEDVGEKIQGSPSLQVNVSDSPIRERDERRSFRRRAWLSTDTAGSPAVSRSVSPVLGNANARSSDRESSDNLVGRSPFLSSPRKADDVFGQQSPSRGRNSFVPADWPCDVSPISHGNQSPSRRIRSLQRRKDRERFEKMSPVKNLVDRIDHGNQPSEVPRLLRVARRIGSLDRLKARMSFSPEMEEAKRRVKARPGSSTGPPSPKLSNKGDKYDDKGFLYDSDRDRGVSFETVPIGSGPSDVSLSGGNIKKLQLELVRKDEKTTKRSEAKHNNNDAALTAIFQLGSNPPIQAESTIPHSTDGTIEPSSSGNSRATSFLQGISRLATLDGYWSEDMEPLLGPFIAPSYASAYQAFDANPFKENVAADLHMPTPKPLPFQLKLNNLQLRLPSTARGNWSRSRSQDPVSHFSRNTSEGEWPRTATLDTYPSAPPLPPPNTHQGGFPHPTITPSSPNTTAAATASYRAISVRVSTTLARPGTRHGPGLGTGSTCTGIGTGTTPPPHHQHLIGGRNGSRIPKPVVPVGNVGHRNYRGPLLEAYGGGGLSALYPEWKVEGEGDGEKEGERVDEEEGGGEGEDEDEGKREREEDDDEEGGKLVVGKTRTHTRTQTRTRSQSQDRSEDTPPADTRKKTNRNENIHDLIPTHTPIRKNKNTNTKMNMNRSVAGTSATLPLPLSQAQAQPQPLPQPQTPSKHPHIDDRVQGRDYPADTAACGGYGHGYGYGYSAWDAWKDYHEREWLRRSEREGEKEGDADGFGRDECSDDHGRDAQRPREKEMEGEGDEREKEREGYEREGEREGEKEGEGDETERDEREMEGEGSGERGLKVVLTMGQDVEEVVRIEVHPSPGRSPGRAHGMGYGKSPGREGARGRMGAREMGIGERGGRELKGRGGGRKSVG